METLIIQPESVDKLETVKAVLKALKVKFITQPEEQKNLYSPSFNSKMKQGEEDKKAGRYKTCRSLEINFLQQALDDLNFWKSSGNKVVQTKISKLIESIEATPFKGLGKPEPLKYEHSGKWFRRITIEQRLIYELENDKVYIFFHAWALPINIFFKQSFEIL